MQQTCNTLNVDNSFTIEEWVEWLTKERCISESVAKMNGVRFSDRGMTIPIRDEKGNLLFNKYRRAPWVHSGPKYLYDKGSKAYLFGAEFIRDISTVYITEGECDAMAMQSLGYYTVSSTGGATTFLPAWKEILQGKKVVLCYDSDIAGVKGAIRTLDILGSAYLAILPNKFGKDVTDILRASQEQELRNVLSRSVLISNDWRKTLEILKSERTRHIQQYLRSPSTVDLYIDTVHARIEEDKPVVRKTVRNDCDKISIANSYPIKKLVKVNGFGFAQCVSGCKDTDWSMKVYKDNHAYAFCCGKRHDAISIYRTLNTNATFAETLEKLA